MKINYAVLILALYGTTALGSKNQPEQEEGYEIVSYAEAAPTVNLRHERDVKAYLHTTPLHMAVKAGALTRVKILLAQDADLNAEDLQKDTPLHEAAHFNRPEIAKVLLENGAQVNAKNGEGKTALQIATSEKFSPESEEPKAPSIELAAILLQYGANFNELPRSLQSNEQLKKARDVYETRMKEGMASVK